MHSQSLQILHTRPLNPSNRSACGTASGSVPVDHPRNEKPRVTVRTVPLGFVFPIELPPPEAEGQMFGGNKALSRLSPALQLRGRCICRLHHPYHPHPPPPYGKPPLKCAHAKQKAELGRLSTVRGDKGASTPNMQTRPQRRCAVNKPATCWQNWEEPFKCNPPPISFVQTLRAIFWRAGGGTTSHRP